MNGTARRISSPELYARLGTASAPLLLDVRRDEAFRNDSSVIIGAMRCDPADAEHWSSRIPTGRSVVAYCVSGNEVSQTVAEKFRQAGLDAAYLDGGFEAWTTAGLPTRKRLHAITHWVTREHPKIDRIACPWLISRFINPLAEFLYVAPNAVTATIEETGATPYDTKDAEFGHVGDCCSFDAIIRIFQINDPALDHLASIVRGADTSRPQLTPQCEGLLAISYGLSANYPDDHEMLKHGVVIYDALYTWCRKQAACR